MRWRVLIPMRLRPYCPPADPSLGICLRLGVPQILVDDLPRRGHADRAPAQVVENVARLPGRQAGLQGGMVTARLDARVGAKVILPRNTCQ